LTITGTDFGATTSNTEVIIDGVEQTIVSASDTSVVVQIVHLNDIKTSNIQFYLPIGFPAGLDDLTMTTGITVTPKLLSVYPNIGSPAGSVLKLSFIGVGPRTQVMIHTAGHKEICSDIWIPSYSVVMCRTKPGVVADAALMIWIGTTQYDCAGTAGACNYKTDSAFMTVTAVTKTATTMVYTGTGFTNSFVALKKTGYYADIAADTTVVDSDT
jgi:IPT/TIG domain